MTLSPAYIEQVFTNARALLMKDFNPNEPRDEHGMWSHTGGTATVVEHIATPITANEARGNSREVTGEEFQRLASTGHDLLQQMVDNSAPIDFRDTSKLDALKSSAYKETQKSWGGMTIDSHTGVPLASNANKYALSVKPPDIKSVSLPEDASSESFHAAIDDALLKFKDELEQEDRALGIFHDDDNHSIDIDPVLVVDTVGEVESIGAFTHAIGGAYNFADGNGYFPPHVADTAKRTVPPGPWAPIPGIVHLVDEAEKRNKQ